MGDWPYTIRHHWIVLLRPSGRYVWIVFGLLLLFALVGGSLAWIPLLLVLAVVFGLRYQEWREELIQLSPRTIRHVRGVKQTTATNAFLRVDRIAGVVLSQTVPGKLLGYGTVHIEATGSHPDLRTLVDIEKPVRTFALLEALIFEEARGDTDPDDVGFHTRHGDTQHRHTSNADTSNADTSPTAPLPVVPDEPEIAPRIYRWRT